MKIENYNNFDDKEQDVLGVIKVKNVDELEKRFEQLDKFYKKGGLVFRGVPEAVYKMYTSSQRDWKKFHFSEYTDFINFFLNETKKWDNGLIPKYLTNNKLHGGYDVSYFSIMQHFGVPTPLLDFTKDPYIALYFASKDIGKSYYDDNIDDINNYISVYYINIEWLKINGYINELRDFVEKDDAYFVDSELAYNNLNINAQEGLFLANTSSTVDLISILKNKTKYIRNNQKFFTCFDIHKSLIIKIREKLKQKGISEKSLFPNLYDIYKQLTIVS